MATLIVGLLVAALVVLAARAVVRQSKTGGCSGRGGGRRGSSGGSHMGVGGMLPFIPMTSVIYTLFRQFVYRRLREKNLRIHASGVEERRIPPAKAERETDPDQG